MKYFASAITALLFCLPSPAQTAGGSTAYQDFINAGRRPDIQFRFNLPLDFYYTDFSDFSDLIGTYNTDLLGSFVVAGPEAGASWSGFYAGLGTSFMYNYNNDNDSLIISSYLTVVSLNTGYDIINSVRFRVTPGLSLRWFHLRLLNYSHDSKIPLTQYLEDRNLDLRFNQLLLSVGINTEYKMYFDPVLSDRFWTLGFYGGYLMKLTESPWIYSYGNRLTTDRQIGFSNFTFGITASFYSSYFKNR